MFRFLKRKIFKKNKRLIELRALQITLAVLVGLLLASWIVVWQTSKDNRRLGEMRDAAIQLDAQQSMPPNTAKIGGPFTLTNQDNHKVSDTNFRGKYLLVYFGYTYCPDLCPTGLTSIAHALDQLGDDVNKVQPLYITVDPERDTPAKLKEYIASFHPKIIGLTGTAQQIASVAKEYQVYYKKGEMVDENDYIMDHSSLIYLMDPNGQFISTFNEEVDPAALVKGLRAAWAKKPSPSKP